jgi:hypothetical protein
VTEGQKNDDLDNIAQAQGLTAGQWRGGFLYQLAPLSHGLHRVTALGKIVPALRECAPSPSPQDHGYFGTHSERTSGALKADAQELARPPLADRHPKRLFRFSSALEAMSR